MNLPRKKYVFFDPQHLPYVTLFHQYLLRHPQISVNDVALISSFFREEEIKAGDCFVRQGNISAKLAFVAEGILKTNCTYSDEEVIRSFSQKNEWIGHWESFIGQKPSPNSVYAISDCRLVTVTLPAFQRLEREFANVDTFWEVIRDELQAAGVNPFKLIKDPKERYEQFIRTQPDLAFELSTEDIAAYLHIPHERLLRILCETLFFL